jgi:8-oxo-dGTP pyrophosphatase MutT (NUDIX family)
MASTTSGTVEGFSNHFKVAPELSVFQISAKELLSKYPGIKVDGMATGVVVFNGNKVLLVQRSPTDSMPNKWETPGGACDAEDSNILIGAARELWEEAGLQVDAMLGQAGRPYFFQTRSGKNIVKYNFIAKPMADPHTGGNIVVKLSDEHQDFVWASVDEVKSEKQGDKDLPFTTSEQKKVILDAFSARGH